MIFKRFISCHSDSSSSEEEMSQFIKTNEIYGKVAKITSGILTKFCCLPTVYNVSSIFNLNVSSFSKNQDFCLKVSIYWSYWLYLFNIGTKCTSPFADVLYTSHKLHNQKMCKCWVKWLKRTALNGKIT